MYNANQQLEHKMEPKNIKEIQHREKRDTLVTDSIKCKRNGLNKPKKEKKRKQRERQDRKKGEMKGSRAPRKKSTALLNLSLRQQILQRLFGVAALL